MSDHLSIAVIETDLAGRIRAINPVGEEILAASRRSLLGGRLHEYLSAPEASWAQLLERSLAQHCSLFFRDSQLRLNKQPGDISAHVAVNALTGEDCLIEIHPLDFASSITRSEDIRHQGHINRRIIENLAHEIRNPLAGIKGAAQRMSEHADARQQAYVELIIHQVDRLNRLLGGLTAQKKRPRRLHNIHRIIEESLRLFGADPNTAQLTLRRYYDPSLPEIAVDEEQITQALLNLLYNAAKACEYRGEITVRSGIIHQYPLGGIKQRYVLALSVQDNGCGIAEDMQTAIFQPLISQFSEGSGLGLPLVQDIMRRHNGAVTLSSEPGHTVFTLIFPYEEDYGRDLDS